MSNDRDNPKRAQVSKGEYARIRPRGKPDPPTKPEAMEASMGNSAMFDSIKQRHPILRGITEAAAERIHAAMTRIELDENDWRKALDRCLDRGLVTFSRTQNGVQLVATRKSE